MRDLDPDTNFQEAQEYFSDQDFSGFLAEQISIDTTLTISEMEILLPKEDDTTTDDVDESEQFDRFNPGIRVPLSKEFFQENILDKQDGSELLTQANFADFLRGMHFSIEPTGNEDFMLLFDLRQANITISYSYTASDETKTKDFVLNFLNQQTSTTTGQLLATEGNAVNSFVNDAYPPEISEAIASEENAERIYLKGGSGSYAEINLFDDANGREAIEQIKANNWIINEASLVFYVDKQPGVIEPLRLYLYNTETNIPLIDFNIDALADQGVSHLSSYLLYGGLLEGEGSELKYTVSITDYINDLVVRNAENTNFRTDNNAQHRGSKCCQCHA